MSNEPDTTCNPGKYLLSGLVFTSIVKKFDEHLSGEFIELKLKAGTVMWSTILGAYLATQAQFLAILIIQL